MKRSKQYRDLLKACAEQETDWLLACWADRSYTHGVGLLALRATLAFRTKGYAFHGLRYSN